MKSQFLGGWQIFDGAHVGMRGYHLRSGGQMIFKKAFGGFCGSYVERGGALHMKFL